MAGFNEKLFWANVSRTDSCWLWTGYINKDGYGEYKSEYLVTRLAHRIAYALDKGALPTLPLDHLCRHRHCVNPDHLEPVTQEVNTRRSNVGLHEANKTHCPHGHPYDEENTIRHNGKRFCRQCKQDRRRGDQARRTKKERQTNVNGRPNPKTNQ